MAEDASGPTWLKIGGLLSGVAALLTAIVTGVATLVDIWPDWDSGSGQHGAIEQPSEPVPGPSLIPSVMTNLVRYEGDGCFYSVAILEKDDTSYRVRHPFGDPASVAVGDLQPARPQPSALQLGRTVFVPGVRASSQARPYPSYKLAIIDDIRRSTVHVRFAPDDPCPVSHEVLALPASEVLTTQR